MGEAQNFVDLSAFNLYSLSNFKLEIAENFPDYVSDIRLKSISVRNDQDQALIGESGVDSGGVGEEALLALSQFTHSGGHHDHSSVLFIYDNGDGESTELQANFRGESHEFSLTRQVSGSQYEHILRFIRETTKKFSQRR